VGGENRRGVENMEEEIMKGGKEENKGIRWKAKKLSQ